MSGELSNLRIPPYNEDAEEACLGALLLNFSPDVMDLVLQYVRADDFYKGANSNIFQAIIDLHEKGAGVDILTVTEQLKSKDLLEKSGGAAYIASLTSSVPSAANIEFYAKTIQECSLRRRLLNVSQSIMGEAFDNSLQTRAIIEKSEKEIFGLSDKFHQASLKTARDVIQVAMDTIEKRYQAHGEFTGVPSGFDELDKLTAGFQESELIILGARPSIGKTAFALSMARNIAVKKQIPCGFFTLEMSNISLMLRLMSQEARVDSNKIRTGLFQPADLHRLTDAAGRIFEAPLIIQDTPNIPLLDLRGLARRMVTKFGIKVLFIDYLGLIAAEDSRIPRHEQMAQVSRSLKSLARELEIPIIALSQVGRQVENKAPGLADLRESGAIEQDADVVMLLHRKRQVDIAPEEKHNEIETEVIVAKQRNGPTDTVKLSFVPQYTIFKDP